MASSVGEWDGVIKARRTFFTVKRALVKASQEYEKARVDYEWACSHVGVSPHYAPGNNPSG